MRLIQLVDEDGATRVGEVGAGGAQVRLLEGPASMHALATAAIDAWSEAYEAFIAGHAGQRPAIDGAPPNPEALETEEEQHDSLFPPTQHKRRRSRHRRHRPRTESAAAQTTAATPAPTPAT